MPGNSFGERFKITTFGESHGKGVGVIIDGVPAGLPINEDDIYFELQFRRPGKYLVSGRRESDNPIILSGVYNGRTTGAPITVYIENKDVMSQFYEEIRYKPRPGHADLPYILKYGYENWDYRGGGRASARETAARVAAGAIAKKLLMLHNIITAGYLKSLGQIEVNMQVSIEEAICSRNSPTRAPKKEIEEMYEKAILEVTKEGDSLGGIVEAYITNVPPGLGEPVFDKFKADLAKAVLSIPAVIGFEYGLGFHGTKLKGSEANDEIIYEEGRFRWKFNKSGGILGGLTNGEIVVFRVAFKPTSSIRKPQYTVDLRTKERTTISVIGRHDPAVAIRGVSVVESMAAIVTVDHALRAGLIPTARLSEEQVKVIEENWERYKKIC